MQDYYAQKILSQLQELFNEDCENYIDLNEMDEGDNTTRFIHALATIAPALIVNKLTNQDLDGLGFNHLANRICAQYSNFVKE
jgi:hypothetical protein